MTSDPAPLSPMTRRFIDREIDNRTFRHADHVLVAYDLLRTRTFDEAAAIYARGIRELAARAGAPEKFNTTITFAFLSLIAERMDGGSTSSFDVFAAANPDLLSKAALDRWYTPERLHSDAARRMFLMPEPA